MNLFPDVYVDSVYEIDFEDLYKNGIKGIIFDVDNTLVPHGAPADERAKKLFARLKALGMDVVFLSNNKEERVKSFCEAVELGHYIYKANKPSVKGYLKACEIMGIRVDEAAFMGDQIFTDIWGARRSKIKAYLTNPVEKWHEEIQIIIKRIPEAVIIALYKICKRIKRRSV